MFDNLLSQMHEQAEEMKKKLNDIIVETEAENGLVKVKANGNRKIIGLEISEEIVGNKETIEDLVIVAINKAIEKAEEIANKETGDMAKNILPDIGNLFG
jgi:DNA-binding YbaB/EbfC family protein